MLRHWKEVLFRHPHVLCEIGVSTRTEIVVVHGGDLLNLHFTPIVINVCSIEGGGKRAFSSCVYP